MRSKLTTGFLQLVLAAAAAIPLGAGLANATPVHASVCYYGAWTYDTVQENPTYGATFWSTVRYQIGYSCAGYADSVYIDYWKDQMSFSNSASYVLHYTTQGGVCTFVPSTWYCGKLWGPDYTQYHCQANCTVWRYEYPRRWFNYDSRIAVFSHWAAINTIGTLNYSAYHQFLVHRLYHDYCC